MWIGRVSNTDYHKNSGYVEAMRDFQGIDLVSVSVKSHGIKEVVPFTSVLDKGYNIVNMNWVEGKQRTDQPVFGKSNHKFKGRGTQYSRSVALLRSGNERQVKVSKGLATSEKSQRGV